MLKIVLELSDKDLRYFRKCLKNVRKGKHGSDESVVLNAAAGLITEVAESEAPEFVTDRIAKLKLLIDMLEDEQWRLAGADRARVFSVLAYFVDPDGLIPDRIPGIGYLDDAIMVELVVSELVHEIQAYEKFCDFRSQQPRDEAKTSRQRTSLLSRMRRRRQKDELFVDVSSSVVDAHSCLLEIGPKNLPREKMRLRLTPGKATSRDIADLLEALSDLYRAHGGDELAIGLQPILRQTKKRERGRRVGSSSLLGAE